MKESSKMENEPSEFSVYQFFSDGSSEKVSSQLTSTQTAIDVVFGLIRSNRVRLGITKKIIIRNSDNSINLEWIHGKGFTYPKEFAGKEIATIDYFSKNAL